MNHEEQNTLIVTYLYFYVSTVFYVEVKDDLLQVLKINLEKTVLQL